MTTPCHGYHWLIGACERRAECARWDRDTRDAGRSGREQLGGVEAGTAMQCASGDRFIPITTVPAPAPAARSGQQLGLFA